MKIKGKTPITMRRFVLGDIHGAHKALVQVLERSNFDIQNDHILFLGDVADGWPETKACIDTLLSIQNRLCLWGNHDIWLWKWIQTGQAEEIWLEQGGQATIDSYTSSARQAKRVVPNSHFEYFKQLKPFFVSHQNECYVHGGLDPKERIENQPFDRLIWDRNLFMKTIQYPLNSELICPLYDSVYIGHTPTLSIQKTPLNISNVWMMDQGAGWNGKLSIMNIDTKEFWQSDNVKQLYPNHIGRC